MESEPAPQKKTYEDKRPRDPERWIRRVIEKYRKWTPGLPFRPDPAFFAIADEVVTPKKTLLGYDRLYVFWQAIHNVESVPGDVAEIGSYRGGSAYFIAKAFIEIVGQEVPIRVFDTFEGHPEAAITADDSHHVAGRFGGTDYETVRAFLSPFAQLSIHKGDVAASLPRLANSTYRLVHIDTDLYQPTLVCLDYFGSRMSPGGVIVIDDYSAPKCDGVPKATLEYLERTDGFQVWDMRTEQLMLVRR
jgi:hypothetical protein